LHVLRIDGDVTAAESVGHRGEGDGRRRHTDDHAAVRARGDRAGELDRISDVRWIHLPVADHETFAH